MIVSIFNGVCLLMVAFFITNGMIMKSLLRCAGGVFQY